MHYVFILMDVSMYINGTTDLSSLYFSSQTYRRYIAPLTSMYYLHLHSSCIHTQTHTHARKHTTHTHIQIQTHTLSLSRTHTHKHIHTHSHTLTLTPFLSHTHALVELKAHLVRCV